MRQARAGDEALAAGDRDRWAQPRSRRGVGSITMMIMMHGTPAWNIRERDPGEPGRVHHRPSARRGGARGRLDRSVIRGIRQSSTGLPPQAGRGRGKTEPGTRDS